MKVLTVLVLGGVICGSLFADGPVVTSFSGNGRVSWNYPTNGVSEYRIEWTSDLSGNVAWSDLSFLRPAIRPESSNMTARVPMYYRVRALGPAPEGMAYIPAGKFDMGDNLGEGASSERPVHTVYVSAFYIDKYEVTKTKWDGVANWAAAHGYDISATDGRGKAFAHPVHTVSWYECVKWCNARSQKEGLFPCYTVGGSTYKTGEHAPVCNWAGGYRLPTEAEWEKVARGRVDGQRFPWGSSVNHNCANYSANGSAYSYDTSPYTSNTYHPSYDDGGYPYTSPVGAFAANGYGVYDMEGNVWEWCNDWYSSGYYASSPESDPHGAVSGTRRVHRGLCWSTHADRGRVFFRASYYPAERGYTAGFRVVMPVGQ